MTLGVLDGVDCCCVELGGATGAKEIAIGCSVPF